MTGSTGQQSSNKSRDSSCGSRILVRGAQWRFNPRGALSPKNAQNRVFFLLNCLKTVLFFFLGRRGAGLQGYPGICQWTESSTSPQRAILCRRQKQHFVAWKKTQIALCGLQRQMQWKKCEIQSAETKLYEGNVQTQLQERSWDIGQEPYMYSYTMSRIRNLTPRPSKHFWELCVWKFSLNFWKFTRKLSFIFSAKTDVVFGKFFATNRVSLDPSRVSSKQGFPEKNPYRRNFST